jgi:tetratricopeptide (TPR) repeat protein
MQADTRAWPWVGTAACGLAAFSISCWVQAPAEPHAESGRSVLAAILGEGRIALSGRFYELADTYFHRGVEHVSARAFADDPFQRLARRVSPAGHAHASGGAVEEMMPWLDLALRMDPHRVDIYLVAAFWLTHEGGRYDLADRVLRDAQAANPCNYEVQLERGRLFLKLGDYAGARKCLDAGLAFWPGKAKPDSRDALIDRGSLLFYRALLREVETDLPGSLKDLEELHALFPDRAGIGERIEAMRSGRPPSVLASRLIRDRLQADVRLREACDRDDEHAHAAHGH